MAKFKVGDKVEILAGPKSGKVGKIETSAPGPQGSEMYHIRLEDGLLVDAIERNLTLANSAPVSTNSVVRNAMAANGKRVATNREIPAQTAIDYFKKLIAEIESLDKKIRPMVTRFKMLVADGNTSSMDFPDRKIVGKPEELRELDKLKDRFEELRDFAKMTMGI